MKKLRLSLEDIAVDSFSTVAPQMRRGTVPAHGSESTCFQIICTCGDPTDGYTCPDSCANSCDGTCNSCNGSCVGCPSGDTCANTCPETCAVTCDGASCPYCSNPPQIVC
jgi:hypothetical protein